VFLIAGPGRRGVAQTTMGASVIALLAFGYSLWAIGGAGTEVVYWGFLLLLAGLPVYVWVVRSTKTQVPGSRVPGSGFKR